MKAIRPTGHHKTRRTTNWVEHEQDPYKSGAKLEDATWCPECSAVYSDGRWHWGGTKDETKKRRCPACQRIHDELPAGYVTIDGPYFASNRDEILQTVRNVEQREKSEHPMQRIMKIKEIGPEILVTTTDAHLARAIGTALHNAYKGDIKTEQSPEENLVRVHWTRQ